MKITLTEKYFLITLLIIVLFITIGIFYPFLSAIILSISFTVILQPVYEWINKNITKGVSWLSSIMTIALFLIILCVPLFFLGNIIFNQTQNAYISISQNNSTPSEFIDKIDTTINRIMPKGFVFNTNEKIVSLVSYISNNITNFFTSTFTAGITFVLMIISMFYLLKDGESWKKGLIAISPFSENNMNEILLNIKKSINRTLRGSLFIAIIQGVMFGVGFAIFGIPNPALWGVIVAIFSFMPGIGTPMVSIPAVLFLYFTGMHLHALGLLIWAITLMGLVDNLLGPYLISRDSDIPSIFILFSILGGMALMGPIGIIAGPLVISLLYTLVDIYKKEIKSKEI